MPSALRPEDALFAVRTTLQEFDRGKATDLMLDLTEYPTFTDFMRRERVGYQSGRTIDGRAITDTNGSVSEVGLYFEQDYKDVDGIEEFSIPWAYVAGYMVLETRLVNANRKPAQLLDMVRMKRSQMWADFAAKIETYSWEQPDPTANPRRPFGIPYSIVKNAAFGFNGGNPAGFPGGTAGLDSVAFSRWRNFSGTYGDFTDDDLFFKWAQMAHLTNFMSPVSDMLPSHERGKMRRMWAMNLITKLTLERRARDQNDRIGYDLMHKDGQCSFMGTKFRYVPTLDDDTTNPIYQIDWSAFNFIYRQGEWFNQTKLKLLEKQPTTMKQDTLLTANTRPVNRRKLGVLYQVAA